MESKSQVSLKTIDSPGIGDFLKDVIIAADKNSSKKKRGARYEETVKSFCTYLYIIGGRLLYETLSANMALPSSHTIYKRVHSSKTPLEGELLMEQLISHLEANGLPKVVLVSEDGTRITGGIEYDSQTNLVVGFVPPLNVGTACPVQKGFKATSARQIESFFDDHSPAKIAYVVMVQPIADGATAVPVLLFGTDNKFKALDVQKRWTFIKAEFAKHGIEILAFSSDGDSRLLSAMLIESHFSRSALPASSIPSEFRRWYFANFDQNRAGVFFQDPTHIAVKLRSRLLKASIVLPMGNKIASLSHLVYLIGTINKSFHKLTNTDLDGSDKMNFQATVKISSPAVQLLLKEYVPDSEGTIAYLDLMQKATTSFMDESLDPGERIYRSWYSVFFCRFWRSWVSRHEVYTLFHNFVSSNVYACLEINAHSMLHLIVQLRDSGRDELFKPWLCGSQQCESFFRQIRSQTSTFSTVVNVSMLGFLHRVRRVFLQLKAISDLGEKYVFPRERVRVSRKIRNSNVLQLPSDDELLVVMVASFQDALEACQNLGMTSSFDDCQLETFFTMEESNVIHDDEATVDSEFVTSTESINLTEGRAEGDDRVEFSQERDDEALLEDDSADYAEDLTALRLMSGELNLRDYSLKNMGGTIAESIPETSPFVPVTDSTGKTLVVRKSTLCWLFSQQKLRASSDRLRRVMGPDFTPGINRLQASPTLPKHYDSIHVSEWCAFESESCGGYLIGLVLSFSYLTGRTAKERQYSLDEAPTSPPKSVSKRRGLGALSHWYEWNKDSGLLSPCDNQTFGFYDLKFYRLTIPRPTAKVEGLFLSNFALEALNAL